MIIRVAESLGTELQGRLLGRKHFAQTCELLAEIEPGQTVEFDFDRVELVTGSWLNAVIVPFYRWASEDQVDLYPVFTNCESEWLDDLDLIAEWNHQCYLLGQGRKRPVRKATLSGSLDPGQATTLNAVLQLGETTGARLAQEVESEGIKATAWNNRLKDLFGKRILKRRKRGREQFYFPVVEDIAFDG